MLDPKSPDKPAGRKGTPALDIFKDAPPEVAKATKTAPEVSGKLLEEVDHDVATESPPPRHAIPALKKSSRLVGPDAPRQDPPTDPVRDDDPLADDTTDAAVTDIAAKEGNALLALQDALGHKATRVAGKLAEEDRRKARRRHWFWLVFVVAFILLVLLALPLDSYTCHWPVGIRLRVTTDILPSVCR